MIVTVLLFLLVLGVLVLVHEAGHAVVARLIGCRVEEFGFGFPPRLFSRRVGETVYSFNLIPLGGFVRITGEDGGEADDPRSFARKSRPARIGVLVAGVVMNLALAVVLFAIIAGMGTTVPVQGSTEGLPLSQPRVEIVEIKDSPILTSAGIEIGDEIVVIQGNPIPSAGEAAQRIRSFGGTALSVTVRRGETMHDLTLNFPTPHIPGEPVGISLIDLATYRVSWWQAPIEGVRSTVRTVAVTGRALGTLARDLVMARTVPEDVAGPIGIATLVGTVSRHGILPLMELTAVLSVNLALMNILPIPALDGGRVLFVLFEMLGLRSFRGRPERFAHAVGFTVLMLLMVLITIRDLQRLIL